LLLLALFALQALAGEEKENDIAIHMSTGKVMTLTFQNPGQHLTVTLPDEFKDTPAPGLSPKDEEQYNAEQQFAIDLMAGAERQQRGGEPMMDDLMAGAERQQRGGEPMMDDLMAGAERQQRGGEPMMEDYMGEEIDQQLDDEVREAVAGPRVDMKTSASMAADPGKSEIFSTDVTKK
jgi:hypothetical protein